MKVDYLINDFRFSDHNIVVSSSTGVIDLPKYKSVTKRDWAERHGYIVDTDMLMLDARTIKLDCAVYAKNFDVFITAIRKLSEQFKGLEVLKVNFVGTHIKLLFGVYLDGGIAITKDWREEDMFGTFNLKLVECEPQKRIYVVPCEPFTEMGYSLSYTSISPFSVMSAGMRQRITAPIAEKEGVVKMMIKGDKDGEDYVIISGNIDDITSLKLTNATLLWDKI